MSGDSHISPTPRISEVPKGERALAYATESSLAQSSFNLSRGGNTACLPKGLLLNGHVPFLRLWVSPSYNCSNVYTPALRDYTLQSLNARNATNVMTLASLAPAVSLCVAGAVLLWAATTIVYRIYFHPLAKYPGPLLGKFTDLLTLLQVAKKERTFAQYDLLQKYGSPCRVGTNHLVFGDQQSWPDIYGQSSNPCLKDPSFYDGLSATGAVNILNAVDRRQHSRLRRLVAHSFSTQALLESESTILGKVQNYLNVTFDGNSDGPVDILPKTYALYIDIVSLLSFGESLDTLNGRNPTARQDVAAFFEVVPATAFAPILRYLPIRSIQEGLQGLERLKTFSRASLEAYISRSNEKAEAGSDGKFLYNLSTATDPETGSKMAREELIENTIIFLTAGSGTTAATTLYLIWACGTYSDVKERLISEIRTAFPDPKVMPSYAVASKLPYLGYVIDEVLRLYGPLSVGCPRISPGKILSGSWVPKGVLIETNPYATARDPEVFPEPFRFNPSRWELATDAMRNMSRPFNYGPRNCVGRHLAEVALVLTISRIYQIYDLVPTASMTADEMRQEDKGVLEPTSSEFWVVPEKA